MNLRLTFIHRLLANNCIPGNHSLHHDLLPQLRPLRFYIWVALSLHNIERDKNCCPLKDCRKGFAASGELLDHVYTCPHLSEGLYWCPDCRTWENFLLGTPARRPQKASLKILAKPLRFVIKKKTHKAFLRSVTRIFVGLSTLGLSFICKAPPQLYVAHPLTCSSRSSQQT